jgi:MFS family permease
VFRFVVPARPPTRPDTPLREQVHPSALAELLSRPRIAFTTAIAGFAQFVDTATFSFLPLVLREYHGLSIGVAGTLFTVYFVVLTAIQPMSGWLADRLGCNPVTIAALFFGIGGYLVLLTGGSFAVVAVGVVGIGLGMGWGPPVQSRFVDALDERERGTGFGLVRTVYIGFAALNGILVGKAAAVGGWGTGIGVPLVSLVVPVVLLTANRAFGVGV